MWRPRLTLANAGSRTERIGGRAILVWPRPQLSAGPGDASSRRASARVPPPYRFHSRWAGRASIRLAPFPTRRRRGRDARAWNNRRPGGREWWGRSEERRVGKGGYV